MFEYDEGFLGDGGDMGYGLNECRGDESIEVGVNECIVLVL